MLKTSGIKSSKPRKDGVEVGDVEFGDGEFGDSEVGDDEIGDNEIGKKVQNLSKSKKTVESSNFITFRAKLAFTKLRQAFFKALILYHFYPKRHIQIETDTSGYIIGRVFRQLTLDNLGQWHPVAFFSQKMIPAETRYETHNGKFLATIETFKTWKYYLEGSQHKVLILTDHNNLHQFINTKSLSSRQVRWAQKLSRYHFRIDYYQAKANKAADALCQYPQQSAEKEETFWAKNVKIFHRLQLLLAKVSRLLTSCLSPLYQVFICETTVLL